MRMSVLPLMRMSVLPRMAWIGALTVFATSLALPSIGHALTSPQTFNFTSDDCSNPCQPSGGVTVTQSGSTLTFDIALKDSLLFLGAQSGQGIDATFAFDVNLAGITGNTLTFSTITSNTGSTFTAVNSGVASSIHMDGAGFFNFGIVCTSCGPGGSNPDGNTIMFSVSATGLDINDLTTSDGTSFFAADVISCKTGVTSCTGTGTGNTGVIDATVGVPGPVIGAGLPGLVMACGGLLALARRRRQAIA
jgi:hypothetical protein